MTMKTRTQHTVNRARFGRTILALAQLCASLSGMWVGVGSPQKSALADPAPGSGTTISGTVFQDYNSNGVMNTTGISPNLAIDSGVAGVRVSAFISGSLTPVATAATNASGQYTLTGLTAGTQYRVEFSGLPADHHPSTHGSSNSPVIPSNGTTVQFASAGTSNVSLGIVRSCDYCQNNPPVAINAFIQGDARLYTNWATGVFGYDRATDRDGNPDGTNTLFSTYTPPIVPATPIATGAQTGNTYGLAWSRTSRKIYTSAYMKRGVGYGPGGPGAIYVTNPSAPASGALYVDLNAVFPGSVGPDTHSFTLGGTAPNQFVLDDAANPDLVGKDALGDLEISKDDRYLFVVNLFDRKLYRIPTSGALNSATITRYDIPTTGGLITSAGVCAANDVRPFALGTDKDGALHVGAVCSGQSVSGANNSHLGVYVWRFDQISGSFTLVLADNPLDNYGGWRPWSNNLSNNANWSRQPMLTDIEFDNAGAMMLAFRGRNADISIPWDPSGGQTYVRSNGDLLLACPAGASYSIEPSGSCFGRASNNPGTWTATHSTGSTSSINEPGPNGNSFYWGDHSGDGDPEALMGALLQVPGYGTVMATAFDAIYRDSSGVIGRCNGGNACNANAAGVQIFSNQNGSHQGSYDAYGRMHSGNNGTDPFVGARSGKLAGMGDIEALCDPAPLEVGNRVWRDDNGDGVQDPGEPGLAGVEVQLLGPSGAVLSTTTTDASGQYFFNLTAISSTLANISGTQWAVRIPLTTTLPAAYGVTNQDTGGVSNNAETSDLRDSDGDNVGALAGSPNQFTTIRFVTRGPGANNHTLDFGFEPLGAQFGDRVWIESDTDGNANTGTITPVAGMIITATSASGQIYTTTTNAQGYYSFTVPAGTYTVTYGSVPAVYGPVLPSNTPGGSSESGNAGSYQQPGNPDRSHTNNTRVTVAPGEANWHVDFAFHPQRYDLGNKVWFDTNNNGIVDAGEQPVSGVLMQLKDASGAVISTTTTDSQGFYAFVNLLAGNYTVTVAASNFAPGGPLHNYLNSDATTAPSNAPADNDRDHGVNPASPAAYLTDGISSGTITLGPGLPSGEDPSAPATPNGDANNNLTIDFGFYKLELGNRVWEDLNNNGLVDPGEPALANVTVELRNANGAVISTTTTNAQGFYTFTRLTPGNYVVALPASNFATGGPLAGLTSSTGANGQPTGPYEPGIGEDNTLAGDNADHGSVVGVLGQPGGEVRSGTITLTPGGEPLVFNATGTTQQPTIDFGLFKPAQVGNYVWYDRNHDGIQNNSPGEVGVGGVTVTLLLNGTPISTTHTDATGAYWFTNLVSGTGYAVRFDIPGTLTFTLGSTANPDASTSNSDVPGGGQTGTTDTFELGYGEIEPDIDAGVYQPASLGDTIWFDMNGNGQQDPGEDGVPGVTATLMISTPAGFVPFSTTVTNAGGYYEFNGLVPNTYYVSFTLPAGMPYTWTVPLTGDTASDSNVNPATGTTAPVTLSAGERNPTIDGGITPYASLGNRVWDDINHDGDQDADEPGVENVMVTLYRNGVVVNSMLTGPNGIYSFTNLISGTYTVTFGLPAGMTFTVQTPNSGNTGMTSPDTDSNVINPGNGSTAPIVLNWGDNNPTIDAGIWRPMALGNRVWFDTNNDGIDNDGPAGSLGAGVNGATMQLFVDSNGDGLLTIGVDQLISTTTTNPNGYYTFTNLLSNTYFVVMPASNFAPGAVLDGYRNSDPTVSGDSDQNERDHGFPQTGDVIASGPITLNYGQEPINDGDADPFTNYSIDFGFYQLTLGNRVWNDLDNDGVKDASEPGLPGVLVSLYDATGALVATTTTDASGVYTFTRLTPGDYVVGITPLPGYISSLGSGGESDPNSNIDELSTSVSDNGVVIRPNGEIRSNPITLTPGGEPSVDNSTGKTANPTVDFGLFLPASLGNYVWSDANANGIQDEPASAGINGVTVRLLDSQGNVIASTVTSNDPAGNPGYYTFTGLASGTYQVEFVLSTLPPGTRVSSPNQGADDALDSDADPVSGRSAPVTLLPGDVNPTIDLGVITTAGLGDFVWIDVNRDGQQDPGEPPVAGVIVTLFQNGAPISSTTTNASGLYQFIGLNPGVPYTLSFSLPDGFSWTTPGSDPASNLDSNVDASGATQPVVLAPGQFNSTIDAGLWRPSTIEIEKSSLNPGAVRAGQTIAYQIVVRNTGLTLARNVVIYDPIPANTTYVSSSPQASVNNGQAVWPAVDLAPGAAYTVTLQVAVNPNIQGVTVITNLASVTSLDQSVAIASLPAINPLNPTAVTLDAFSAQRDPAGVLVQWRTSSERDTLGFNVWRAAGSDRASAVKINQALILAQGPSGGRYTFADAGADGTHSYWIEEIELSGASLFYGPALATAPVDLPAAAPGATTVIDHLGGVSINHAVAAQPAREAAPIVVQSVAPGGAAVIVPTAPDAVVTGADVRSSGGLPADAPAPASLPADALPAEAAALAPAAAPAASADAHAPAAADARAPQPSQSVDSTVAAVQNSAPAHAVTHSDRLRLPVLALLTAGAALALFTLAGLSATLLLLRRARRRD